MTTKKKLLLGAAGTLAASGDALDVTDVFSTHLYDGLNEAHTIENGLALGNSNDGGSVKFDGRDSNTVALYSTNTSAITINTNTDFCMEAFVYLLPWDGNQAGIMQIGTPNGSLTFRVNAARTLRVLQNNVAGDLDSSTTLNVGQWYHVAATRSGSTLRIFIDGTQDASGSNSVNYTNVTANDYLMVGGRHYSGGFQAGIQAYISNARFVVGSAVYTSNFTPTTSDLTAISGTELLTCQGDTPLVDNSSNSYSMSIYATDDYRVKATEFGPFTGSDGKGGMIWFKNRGLAEDPMIVDTERGGTKDLYPNESNAEDTDGSIASFNSNGFSFITGANKRQNVSSYEYVSWAFRKASKFFDVQTFTTTNSSSVPITVNHDLGQTPGFYLVKRTDAASDWFCFHRSEGATKYGALQNTDMFQTGGTSKWYQAPDSSSIYLGNDFVQNASYVAYFFGHNSSGDGGYGSDSDEDIISCGTYTGNGSSSGPTVTLGWQPQWLMIKRSDTSGPNWNIYDAQRGIVFNENDAELRANTNDAEYTTAGRLDLTATGFKLNTSHGSVNGSGKYIYIAVRRGPLKPPSNASDVFGLVNHPNDASNVLVSGGFTTDMVITTKRAETSNRYLASRLTGERVLKTNDTTAISSDYSQYMELDRQQGVFWKDLWGNQSAIDYHWKRAPSYFDCVTFVGTGSARTIDHSLKKIPEMIWVKRTSGTRSWFVYHSALGNTARIKLDTTDAAVTGYGDWNSTTPTSSVFSVGSNTNTNGNGENYIALLFATLANVSKVGSWTGDGTNGKVIDCGFTSGARYILARNSSETARFDFFDTYRGIIAGNDPRLSLNNTDAEESPADYVDPHSSGFIVNGPLNDSGDTWIFYAVA